MRSGSDRRRWFAGLALAASALCFVVVVIAVFHWLAYRQAADYPGAALVSDHTLYRFVPRPAVRRDTSYRTADQFPAVYHWYSTRFQLGPEARAHSACILMERGSEWFLLRQYTGVSICDTRSGRLVFVTRSVLLR